MKLNAKLLAILWTERDMDLKEWLIEQAEINNRSCYQQAKSILRQVMESDNAE